MNEQYRKYIDNQKDKFLSLESQDALWSRGQKRYITRTFANIARDSKILDIACGDGVGLACFKSMGFTNVEGVELSQFKTRLASQIGYKVYTRDIHNLYEIPDKHYDIVYSSHTLEHAIYPITALKELKRILRDNGTLFMVLPYPDEDIFLDEAHLGGREIGTHMRDNGETVRNFFIKEGFLIESCEYDSYRQAEIWLKMRKG